MPTSMLLLFLFLHLHLAAIAAEDTQFTFHGFKAANLTLTGFAEITNSGLLRLTNNTKEVLGHAFYHLPIRLNASSSFSTTFVFVIVPEDKNMAGQGLTFALSPTETLSGSGGHQYLGLVNDTSKNKSTNHLIAVEFDTVQNHELQDIDDNHIGIDVNGVVSRNSTHTSYYDEKTSKLKNLSLTSGEPMQVWVDYDGLNKIMFVRIAPLHVVKPSVPTLMLNINITEILLEDSFVGFSSSTGGVFASHYILGWSFCLGGEAPPLDLYKLPPLPKLIGPKSNISSYQVALFVFAGVVIVGIIAVGVVIYVQRMKKFREIVEDWEIEYGPQRFSYKELYKATDGFNDGNVIGVGGFGRVYKGLSKTTKGEIAVKRVSHDSRQGIKEFVAEIASMGRLRHRNLVQLLGYCRREGELLLVYEYMANGSLDKWLFADDNSEEMDMRLKWPQRFHIIKGVAEGLLYLHEGWEQVVVHRDIKASNVLLDGELNGKLSDFGLARLYDRGSDPRTTRVVGTLGYLAPELAKHGKATTQTDVFAFGSFLLEVACGRRPMDTKTGPDEDPILVDWVMNLWKKGAMLQVMDSKLKADNKTVKEEVELILRLGLLCSHPNPSSRPSIRHVVQMLEGEVPVSPSLADISASTKETRRHEGFDDFVMSYPYSNYTSSGGSSTSALVSLLSNASGRA